MKKHHYSQTIVWTGNKGTGTEDYVSYDRDFIVEADGKHNIEGSSDPSFRGDPARYNPEELLLSAVSSCHMLWYLHLCAQESVIITAYSDHATGTMEENASGSGQFIEITLYPHVKVANAAMVAKALALHEKANESCFVANSLNFPVHHQSTVTPEAVM